MLTPDFLKANFDRGLPYDAYVATGSADQQARWRAAHDAIALADAQRSLIASFTRRLHVLVSSGTWCGDCVVQVPMIAHAAAANPRAIHLRVFDRDAHAEFAQRVRICGGLRVPTVVFANEDFDFLTLHGDKSIARLRALAKKSLGASCEVPGAPQAADEKSASVQDWVTEFERAHLIARLSAKLRERHGD